MADRIDDMVEVFKGLGNPTRLRIVEILRSLNGKDVIVGIIAVKAEIRPSVASKHLRILEKCGVVEKIVSGRYVLYGLKKKSFKELGLYIGALR